MLKLLLAAFDIGTVLLLPGLLRQLGRPPAWALLYAWHPLAVGEVVARGHLDSIGIFFLVLSVRLLISTSPAGRALSGASLAASMLSKGYAVLALPYLLLVAARRRLWFVLGLLVTVASAYLPFLSAGSGLFRGLAAYAGTWRGNASVFALIEWLLPVPRRVGLARLLCGLLLAAWVLSALLRQRRVGAERLLVATDSCFSALAAFLLLSPVVYPWYLAWTIPFLCLHVRWGWLALTGTVFAFYAHDFAGHHAEIWWVTVVEYTLPMATAVGAALLGHAHSDQQARQGMSSRPPNRSRRTPRAIPPPWEIHSDYRD